MKKIIGQFSTLTLLCAWAGFAISSSHTHTHECKAEWQKVFSSYGERFNQQSGKEASLIKYSDSAFPAIGKEGR
jgi:hypothetical protein